jgi:hypothetical protein
VTASFAIFPISSISYASNDEYSFENGMTQTLNTLKTVSRDSVSYKFPIFIVITKKDLFHETFNLNKFKEIFIKFQGNNADEALEYLQFHFENFDPKIKSVYLVNLLKEFDGLIQSIEKEIKM